MVRPIPQFDRLLAGLHVPRGLLMQAGWTTFGYGTTQIIRFASTVILTRLLAPELFGISVLLVSLRIGMELFSDLGIGTSVVASQRTRDPVLYRTAWTMQFLRGVLLAVLALALLPLFGSIYDDPALRDVLPTLALFLLIAGAHSIAPAIATKELRTKRIAAYEIGSALAQAALTIAAVLVSPTIWGLIIGQLLGALVQAAASYLILPDVRCRPLLDRAAFRELFSFGKWIFLSSIVFFLSTYMDRLMLGKLDALAMLGIYGVARALGDAVAQFGSRMANTIVFPKVAAADVRGEALRARVTKRRAQFVLLMLAALALLIAFAEPIIRILYDARYWSAAPVLPWIALATWLAILNSMADSFALGVAKPQLSMIGHLAKLAALVALLPLGIESAGIVGAAAAAVAAEMVRYAALNIALARERLVFVGQDALATALLIGSGLALYALASAVVPALFTLPPFAIYPA
ncbi:oligosaccharide flippase family protein [Qipengyuania sediminis]|uniref:oligosaccharide flippase family protein n=1 Tax=Qipengyuania sediminis TaxID=1532023 RepID=UPI00105950CE|nr:oligosaccharide flippase family protein [Qipengyuania sediminis]